MSNEIIVLHFQDDRSDKFWAINTEQKPNATYDVWYGRRGSKLAYSELANMDWQERMQQKLDKGYKRVDGVTIDKDTSTVVPYLQDTEDELEVPASLWYRVSSVVPLGNIRDYLHTTIHFLSNYCVSEVDKVKQLPTFTNLYEGKRNGGSEYLEGPLAVFLLFGLRRYLNDIADKDSSSDELVQIADDSNSMLPHRFSNLGVHLAKAFMALGNEQGWHVNRLLVEEFHKEYIDEIAEKHDLKHYTMVTATNPLAIAMGCIDEPINLAVIRTDKKAAFF